MCFDWAWLDTYDQSVFGVSLADQDRHVDLECPGVRVGFAKRVSNGPVLSKTINVRLESLWKVKTHTHRCRLALVGETYSRSM